jgi:hypothetical protein
MPQAELGKEAPARGFVALKSGALSAIFIVLGALWIGQMYGFAAERLFGLPPVWAFTVINNVAPLVLSGLVVALVMAWGPLVRWTRQRRSTPPPRQKS